MSKSKNNILLIITGSIAAIKCFDIVRALQDDGCNVTIILTKSGAQFLTPTACEAISGNKVYSQMFEDGSDSDSIAISGEMEHIRLARENDAIIVAPASADFIGKMACGLADDLASTVIMAADIPIFVAPAMNHIMWKNKALQRNIKLLLDDNVTIINPEDGQLACGEIGTGRMAGVDNIVAAIDGALSNKNLPLSGKKALVTSGPTIEKIDPVRYISNHSSGKQGYAIAKELSKNGADVTLITGPTNLPSPQGMKVVQIESAQEMLDICSQNLPVDIAICAAAVSDWKYNDISAQKLKKEAGIEEMTFKFAINPDILAYLSQHKTKRPQLVVGFAAESEHIIPNAQVKLEKKQCDWIVANDISGGKVFNDDKNKVHIISSDSQDSFPIMSKDDVAKKLVEKIVALT